MYELPETTEFIGNGIGIDPAGCGCTDCILRHAFPLTHPALLEAVSAALVTGRPVYNRTGTTVTLRLGLSTTMAFPPQ